MPLQVLGVDPGSGSWDFYSFTEEPDGTEEVKLDISITTKRITQNPQLFTEILSQLEEPYVVAAPSGFGLPLTRIQDLTEDDIKLTMLKRPDKGDKIIIGLAAILGTLHEQQTPGYVLPSAKHLPTVPVHRKINRIDLGTADKVCTAAVGLQDQSEQFNIPYEQTAFIMIEIGVGFTAVLAIEDGKIIDGIGGTNIMGIQACGGLDGELAYLIGNVHKHNIYGGGVAYIAGFADLGLEELLMLAEKDEQTSIAVQAYIESLIKAVYAISTSFSNPQKIREILISGRAARQPKIMLPLEERLSSIAPFREMKSYAQVAKRAAQGSAFIASGLAGGKYSALVDCMQIKQSAGSILDYIYVPHDEPFL
ncbi:MAG TPA: DUF1464 family protein [Candidatus Lokiarchaeia archaeon]|nr:DUF1464 family protein [Candidatus Lokiarchaeia archaeon]